MSSPFTPTLRLLRPFRTSRGPQSIAEVLRRKDLARRQVKNKKEKRLQKERADKENDQRKEFYATSKAANDRLKEARRRQKEDYELGPLAPRRDVGEREGSFGAVDPSAVQEVEVLKWQRQWCPFELGDRVVVLEGKDKGKIGVVNDINEDNERVFLKDLNMVGIAIPQWMIEAGQENAKTRAVPRGLPYNSLRLVYPLPNPTTGQEQDVIIERLERRKDWKDETTNEQHYKRVVPDLKNFVIPKPPHDLPFLNDHEDDTLRLVVERETFQGPSLPLLSLPMPPTVIDELRNKHSKFSNRRVKDAEYIAKIEAREENNRQKTLRMMVAMRTPLEELRAFRAQKKKERLLALHGGAETESVDTTYLEVREGKPWTRKMTYDAKQKWKQEWGREKQIAKNEGRKAKKPNKSPQELEPVDKAFLASLGAMMQAQGLDGSRKATELAATV